MTCYSCFVAVLVVAQLVHAGGHATSVGQKVVKQEEPEKRESKKSTKLHQGFSPPLYKLPRSCRHSGFTKDGVYHVKYLDYRFPVYCDMTRDGGGWMLLLSNRGSRDWNLDNIRRRNMLHPGLDKEYSILAIADIMRRHSLNTHFEYRLEATGRGKWGGIWRAPVHYSLVSQTDTQRKVTMQKRFSGWKTTGRDTIRGIVPWIDVKNPAALLTTRSTDHTNWWGTLVMKASSDAWDTFGPFPWIAGGYNLETGKNIIKTPPLYYWIRL